MVRPQAIWAAIWVRQLRPTGASVAILVAPVFSTLGGARAARPPAVSVSAWLTGRQSVSTHDGSRTFSPAKGKHPPGPPQALTSGLLPVPGAFCTVVSEWGRAESSFLRVDHFVTCDRRSSCRVVETGPLRRGGTAAPACFVRTRSMPTPPTDALRCGHHMMTKEYRVTADCSDYDPTQTHL